MTPPAFLYKYQAFDDRSWKNLTKNQIWFSKPIRLNDPYDCAVRPPVRHASDHEWTLVYTCMRSSLAKVSPVEFDQAYWTNCRPNDRFKDMIFSNWGRYVGERQDEFLNNSGVACFSEEDSNLLMWSHYGSKHTGFCIQFDTTYEPFGNALKVRYSQDIPSASPADLYLALDYLGKVMVGTKAKCWEYESEWRILDTKGDKAFDLDPRCIAGVYFGLRIAPEQKAQN